MNPLRFVWCIAVGAWLAWVTLGENQPADRAHRPGGTEPVERPELDHAATRPASLRTEKSVHAIEIVQGLGQRVVVGFLRGDLAGVAEVADTGLEICVGKLDGRDGSVVLREAKISRIEARTCGSCASTVMALLSRTFPAEAAASAAEYVKALSSIGPDLIRLLADSRREDSQVVLDLLSEFSWRTEQELGVDAEIVAHVVKRKPWRKWHECVEGGLADARLDVLSRFGVVDTGFLRALVDRSSSESLSRFASLYRGEVNAEGLYMLFAELARRPAEDRNALTRIALRSQLGSGVDQEAAGRHLLQLMQSGQVPICADSLRLLWKLSADLGENLVASAICGSDDSQIEVVLALISAPDLMSRPEVQALANWPEKWSTCLNRVLSD